MNYKNPWLARVLLLTAALAVSCGTDAVKNSQNNSNCTRNPVTGECDGTSSNNNSTGTNSGTNNTTATNNVDRDPWADTDGDGFIDRFDNCRDAANADQADGDQDGIGDACDNCLEASNFDQADDDANGIGDACEDGEFYDPTRDDDGDGAADTMDNCSGLANPDQADADADSLGDACDNCPNTANIDQVDSDANGIGDSCEPVPAGMICGEQQSDFTLVKPNIFIVLDASGSMNGTPLAEAKASLNAIADNLATEARFGMGSYEGSSCGNTLALRLGMGDHTAAAMKAAWAPVATGGVTPTADALRLTRTQGYTSDGADPQDALRTKAVVLITDGAPNECNNPNSSAEAASLLALGIKTYVIGFNFGGGTAELNSVAMAGGTDAPGGDFFYTASNQAQLTAALQMIATDAIACSYTLNPPPEDENKIWVELAGAALPRANFTYDAATNVLSLDAATCTQLRSLPPNPAVPPLKIILGCATECVPATEVCDYMDNDCDGEIDEGCEGCSPEVCDGIDNDCDDAVDEGCPDCVLDGETCEEDGDCCFGNCREDLGICGPPCRPLNTSCRENDDCCSGVCAKQTGADVGICIGG